MAKAYRTSVDWANEEYSYFERIHSKNKARKVSEKAEYAARRDKEIRMGIPMPEEPIVCGMKASEFFDYDPEPYAA